MMRLVNNLHNDTPEEPGKDPKLTEGQGSANDDAGAKLVGPYEAARLLRVGASTVQRWIDAGDIPAHRTLGGHRRIMIEDLYVFAERKGIPLARALEVERERFILMVDDDTDLLEAFSVRISNARPDLNVVTASNGFQAGYLLNRHHPRAVLLDIRMPGLNGVQVCRLIRNDARLSNAHVVGMTAYRDSEIVDEMRRAGANHVLFKPIDPVELLEWLETILPKEEKILRDGSG